MITGILSTLFLLLVSCTSLVSSFNILGIFPFHSKSHYAFIDPLMVRLAEKGHKITIFNPFPKPYKIPNYTEVSLNKCFVVDNKYMTIDLMLSLSSDPFKAACMLFIFEVNKIEKFEECLPLKQLLNSTEKYDLLITEAFATDFPLMYADKFKIPVVAYIPNTLVSWLVNRMANPSNPSYIPNVFTGYLGKMNFIERVINTVVHLQSIAIYHFWNTRNDNMLIKHYLGESASSMHDLIKNTSVLLTNSHESFTPIIPTVPGVINVGGIHIKPAVELPKDIEKFINESVHGVVYFCMGSLLRGETFPEAKRNAFLKAFSRLPQRVLWKWEGDVLPGKSDNIMISKWMPQRDILAHSNVKLFISHGGLLGTSEAVYEGVPILGIPIFGDQRTNLKSIEANGAGEILDYNDISTEVVFEKVNRLINDPKYKTNAMDLSFRYKDRPMSPLDTAVYWTEYVIRHKGAPHLKTAAVHMPWYQYLLLDVIAFLLFIIVCVVVVVYYITKITLKFIYNLIFGRKSNTGTTSILKLEKKGKIKKS